MKKIWMMTAALGLGIWLTGCSPAFVPVEDPSESQTEERNSPETEKDDQREDLAFQPISEEERRRIVTELESFDGDLATDPPCLFEIPRHTRNHFPSPVR